MNAPINYSAKVATFTEIADYFSDMIVECIFCLESGEQGLKPSASEAIKRYQSSLLTISEMGEAIRTILNTGI